MQTRTVTTLSLLAAITTVIAASEMGAPFLTPLNAQVIHQIPDARRASGGSQTPHAAPLLHRVKKSSTQAIAVLVNDEPITNYEIAARQSLLGSNAKGMRKVAEATFKRYLKAPGTSAHLKKLIKKIIAENPGKSREEILAIFERQKKSYAQQLQRRAVASARKSLLPGLRKKAIEELIDERLQLQEARRLNVIVSDEDVSAVISDMAKNRKMTAPEFAALLKKMGSDIDSMKSRIKAKLSWRNVIRSRFGQQISVKSGDVDRYVAQTALDTAAKTDFKLQRIVLAIAPGAKPAIVANRLKLANDIRQAFTSCSTTGTLVKNFGGARLENIGEQSAASIKEPVRSMILNAADGEILPPQMARGAVHLWIVCSRKAVSGEATQRSNAKRSLQIREFEVLGQRHLGDLRQDAHIEYR